MPTETYPSPHPARARLDELIARRLRPGADTVAIDAAIWAEFGEEWAVLYTDLVGFSRKVEAFGIIHFLQIIHESRCLLEPAIRAEGGVLVKEEGDSLLILYRDPKAALRSALAMHEAAREFSRGRADEDRIELCLGLGWGRVLKVADIDVFGSEVNAACKLGEDRAGSGETLATEAFARAVDGAGPWRCVPVPVDPLATRQVYRIDPVGA